MDHTVKTEHAVGFQSNIFSQVIDELFPPLASIFEMVRFLSQIPLDAQQRTSLDVILASVQQLARVEAKISLLLKTMGCETNTITKPENLNSILLVETEETVGKNQKRLLEKLGYMADIAETGQQALEMVRNNDYDLILMNIGLPDIDGIDVSRQIRVLETDQRTMIVLLTAFSSEEIVEECRAAAVNIDKIIVKPMNINALQELILQFALQGSEKNAKKLTNLPIIADDASEELMQELIEMFPDFLAKIRLVYHLQDRRALLQLVNKMHSNLCYTGTPQLQEAAKALEISLKNNVEFDQSKKCYRAMMAALDAFVTAYCKRYGSYDLLEID